MTLEKLLDYYKADGYFMDALDVLSTKFHVYEEDEGVVVEEDALSDFEWRSGVSKVCILFSEFVLKTGISGFCYDYDWEKNAWLEEYRYTDWDINYADLEYQVYQQACIEGVNRFFASMLEVEQGIYMQELCEVSLENMLYPENGADIIFPEGIAAPIEYETYELARNAATKDGLVCLFYHMRIDSYAFVRANFSLEDLVALQTFVERYDINDIHNSNIGICNGVIKIFDYSGYCSKTSEKIIKFSK